MTRRIVPIVEGHSEAHSIPEFLRRILRDREIYDVEPDRAIREHRQRLVKTDVFLNRVRMAEKRENCSAVLVIFDSDDDAACVLGPSLTRAAQDSGIDMPCSVILAVREIEAWLIAGVESIRGYRGIPDDLSTPDDPEAIRGAKEWLGSRMRTGYKATIDQLPLLLRFDYQDARQLTSSFGIWTLCSRRCVDCSKGGFAEPRLTMTVNIVVPHVNRSDRRGSVKDFGP